MKHGHQIKSQHEHHAHHAAHGAAESATAVKDPVCGMTVDPATSRHRYMYSGTTYHFCSAGCREKFAANPEQYLKSTAVTAPASKPGVIYACPMHPQIRWSEPGSCPICGMAFEPVAASLETGPNPELADMTRRFWIGAVLTVPITVLEMGGDLVPGFHDLFPPSLAIWLQLLLATPVVLWAGWPFFQRGWASIVHRSLNVFTLIALGTGAAYAFSLVATVAPGLFRRGSAARTAPSRSTSRRRR